MTAGQRRTTRLGIALLGLSALPALLGAQSLGDAAKKENDRREKLRATEPRARAFSDQDLAATKGTLANDPSQPPASAPDERAAKEEAASAGDGAKAPS